jgi:hypothetical protein
MLLLLLLLQGAEVEQLQQELAPFSCMLQARALTFYERTRGCFIGILLGLYYGFRGICRVVS